MKTACLAGLAADVALYLAFALMSGTWDPRKYVLGKDRRASSSKLQFLLWTAVVGFSYAAAFATYAARASQGQWDFHIVIPPALIAAMGLSTATLVGAKAITTSQVASGSVAKENAPAPDHSGLVRGDSGDPDFAKAQMLGWTLIALVTYAVRMYAFLEKPPAVAALPDLDESLVFLSGIGQAAYLGKKFVTTEVTRLTGITPASGRAPLPVTIVGMGFGQREGGAIAIDGAPVAAYVAAWSNERIELTLPGVRPDGTPWPRDRAVSIGVVAGGRTSVNTLSFTFA